MSEYIERGAIKVIEVIGVSDVGFEDAVTQAVSKASKSISGITGVEVTGWNGAVKDGQVTQYRAHCKIAFVVR